MCNLFSVDLNDSSKDNSKELKDPVKFFEDKRPATGTPESPGLLLQMNWRRTLTCCPLKKEWSDEG